jgi:two-component system cell cycle sensor histidine kinase/response regulator CckA
MMGPLRLLQIEDNESDAELIARELRRAGYEVTQTRVDTAEGMRTALRDSSWDAIVCDYQMPGFDAPAALEVLQETGRDIPFLVVSGAIGEEQAVAMMKAGAHDYLMKGNLARLGAAVERELRDAKTRAERRRALEALAQREAQLALAIEATETGVFDYHPQTGKVFCSNLARRHLLLPDGMEPTLAGVLDGIHPEDRERVRRSVELALRPGGGGRYEEEYRMNTPAEGEERWLSAWGKVLHDTNGAPARFVGVVRDVSEQKRAEREMQFQLQLTSRITEQSTDCILLTDVHGMIRFANPEAERVFGFSSDEFRGRQPHDLLHHHYPDGRPYPQSDCPISKQMCAWETVREHEEVLFHRSGKQIEVSMSFAPLELNGVRIGIVLTFRDITERKRAERALRQSDERFRRLFGAQIVGIVISDAERILEANDYFLQLLGYTRQEFFAQNTSWRTLTSAEDIPASERALHLLLKTGSCAPFEKKYIRKDGATLPVVLAVVTLREGPGPRFLGFIVDLTERKSLENQVRQAQKLESVGLLAGGVAHDFNNLLTVIIGYSDMVLERMDLRHPFLSPLNQISTAANRAANLTRQLLTFSRRNASAPKTIRLDEVVLGVCGMLHRLIGEHIEVITGLGARHGGDVIFADPGLIEQVVINLAVNARDAMPGGGRLYIETSRLEVNGEFMISEPAVAPGAYVSLTVTDTGTGMTPEVQARVFEPFYTTKEPGKGTGLGLSTVYGIVQQSGGSINIHSTMGIGTSFRVLFPAVENAPSEAEPERRADHRQGDETVLLVEDEAGVRHFVRDVLEAQGYRVLDAANGPDALEIAGRFRGPLGLLLTDVALPGMNGTELIRLCREIRPGIPALYMSGYSERFGAQLGDGIPHLQKPFSRDVLLDRIRELLDAGRSAAAG